MIDFDVNIVALIITTAASMILGSLWYSPLVFGTTWMKLVGLTEEDAKKSMGSAMAMGLLVSLLGNYVLAVLLASFGPPILEYSIIVTFLVWLGVAVPVDLDKVIWARGPVKLFYINSLYKLLSLLIAATIFTILGW